MFAALAQRRTPTAPAPRVSGPSTASGRGRSAPRPTGETLDLDDINAQLDVAAGESDGYFDEVDFDTCQPAARATSAPTTTAPQPPLLARQRPATPQSPAVGPASRPAPDANAGESPFARLARLGDASAALREQLDAQASAKAQQITKEAQDREAAIAADPAWTHDDLPAGSAFTAEEWEAARAGRKFIVFEMRTGSQGALIQAERRPAGVKTMAQVGKEARQLERPLSQEVANKYLDPLQEMMFDGCLLLGPAATTTHPGSVANTYTMKGEPVEEGGLGDWVYRIVRPKQHRETMPWMFTATGWGRVELAAPEAHEQSDEDEQAAEEAQRPRMTG